MNQSYPPVLPHFSFRSSVQIYKIDFALWMIIDDNPPNLMDAWWQLKNFFSAPLSSPFFRSLLTAFASEDLDQLRFSSLKIKSKTWSHHSLRDYQCSAFISTWRSNTNIWQRHLLCDSDNQQWLHNKFLNSVDWPAFGALDAILHNWDLISLGSGKSVSFSWFILCPFVRRLSLYVFWNGFYTIKKFFLSNYKNYHSYNWRWNRILNLHKCKWEKSQITICLLMKWMQALWVVAFLPPS